MLGKLPALPKVKFGLVDVRDVAQAHLLGLKVPEAANNRFILCKDMFWFTQIGQILKDEWSDKGYKPTTGELPKFVATIG